MTIKRLGAGLLCVAALGLVACGGGKKKQASHKPTTTSAAPTTTTPAVMPLTGLPADASKAGRPALVVKIDNSPEGRPQHGINQVDLAYEEQVEGGITRLFAVFHSQDVDEVGPVRSARSTDIAIASALNKPLFAYSGTNAAFQALVNQAPLVILSQNAKPSAYYRKSGRRAPYNLWGRFGDLYSAAPQAGGPPPQLFTYRAANEPPAGDPATTASVLFKANVSTAVTYTWDAASGTYKRVMNGTPHVDDGGTQVAPKNVIIEFTEYVETPYVDQAGTHVPEAKIVGEGDVWVLSAGKVVKGRWHRDNPTAPTKYLDAAGNPIKLTPGITWVELPPPGQATVG